MSAAATLQQTYVDEMPRMQGLARHCFRHLPPEARDEAVQNTLALSWTAYAREAARGRAGERDLLKSIVFFAVKQTRSGRMPQGQVRSREVLERGRRGELRRSVAPLDAFVGRDTPVPDQVAFRVDTAEFLATLTDRQRAMASELMTGAGTGEVARKFGVSLSAVSQFRARFRADYEEFLAA